MFRAVSDFDMAIKSTRTGYELPFGRKQRWGSSCNRAVDAVFGGWRWSGLYKWTTGLPFAVQNGFQFPTNWDLNGLANFVGQKPTTGVFAYSGGEYECL